MLFLILLCGFSFSDQFVKIYQAPNIEKYIGINSFTLTQENGFAICGNHGFDILNINIAKFDSNGNLKWNKEIYAGSAQHNAYNIIQTFDNGFYL